MALGKTVSYIPFEETSFGYGSGEIASAWGGTGEPFELSSAIATVTITLNAVSGNHWDSSTGHISTPSVGTATSVYNKNSNEWRVIGERDDVDAVLAAMVLFPSDYPLIRNWTPEATYENVTTGVYPQDEPTFFNPIPDSVFDLKLYAGATLVQQYQVTCDATQPVYGNQRPYWSIVPTSQDTGLDSYLPSLNVGGGLLDFGTISHGLDSENVTVTCTASNLPGISQSTGQFTPYQDMYVGDKKPTIYNRNTGFTFTGSIKETQTFLDTVRWSRSMSPLINKPIKMRLTLSDGVIESRLDKYIWFGDKQATFTNLIDQSTTEETPLILDTTGFEFTNPADWASSEINTTVALLTFSDTSGIASSSIPLVGNTITVNSNSVAEMISDIGAIQLDFNPDYRAEFSFTLDITLSNLAVGSIHTATQQSVNCSIVDVPEYSFPAGPPWASPGIQWNEDDLVDFDTELVITDQAFGGSANYQYTGRARLWDGSLEQELTTASWRSTSTLGATIVGNGRTATPLVITGTRSQVNDALANMQMIPDMDWTTSPMSGGRFWLSHNLVRTNDSVTIAQDNVLGDEQPEEAQYIQTYFQAGTTVAPVAQPSTLKYYGNPNVRADPEVEGHPTISYINQEMVQITELNADFHGLTYSCYFWSYSDIDVYVEGIRVPGEYVEDGYLDNNYVAMQWGFSNLSAADMNEKLNQLQITGGTQDAFINFYFVRSDGVNPLWNGNTTFEHIQLLPNNSVITVVNENTNIGANPSANSIIGKVFLTPAPMESIYGISDSTPSVVTDYVQYLYDGVDTLEHEFKIHQMADYTETSGFIYDWNEIPTGGTSPYDNYVTTLESANSRIKVDLGPSPADALDESPKYVKEQHVIKVAVTNPVYLVMDCARYQFEREELGNTGTYIPGARFYSDLYSNPDTNQDVDRIHWVAADGTTPVYNSDFDHLFGATAFDDLGTKKIKFYDLNITVEPLNEYTLDTTENQTIEYTTGWSEDAAVVDTYFQNNTLTFYALITNTTTGHWKLVSVDTSNGYQLNTSNSAVVQQSGNDDILTGSIGALRTGEAFLSLLPSTLVVRPEDNNHLYYQFKFFHEDTGGTEAWGLKQQLFFKEWSDAGDTYAKTTSTPEDKQMFANTTGWMNIGSNLYWFNSVTGLWVRSPGGGAENGQTTDSGKLTGKYNALTPDYFTNSLNHTYALNIEKYIGPSTAPYFTPKYIGNVIVRNLYSSPVSTQYLWGDVIRGHKRSNTMLVNGSSINVVYRLTT